MAVGRTIELPLGQEVYQFFGGLSSSIYRDAIIYSKLITPGDFFFTFFVRYARLFQRDVPGAMDSTISTNGFATDFLVEHHLWGAFITIAVAAFSLGYAGREYFSQKETKKTNSYQFIHNQLNQDLSNQYPTLLGETTQEKQERIKKDVQERINQYLNEVLAADANLLKKYSRVSVNDDGKLILESRQAKPATPKVSPLKAVGQFIVKKIISPIWHFLGIASTVYWILWIAGSMFTGHFGYGIEGLGSLAGFGIPLLLSLPFLVMKGLNWDRHRKMAQNPNAATLEETQEAASLMRRAMLQHKFAMAKNQCLSEAEQKALLEDRKIQAQLQKVGSMTLAHGLRPLTQDIKTKTATTFASTLIGSYIAAQYSAWIVTDFIIKGIMRLSRSDAATYAFPKIVNIIGGWALMAIALVHAIYRTAVTYQQRKGTAESTQELLRKAEYQSNELEQVLKDTQARVKLLKARLPLVNTPETPAEFSQPKLYTHLNVPPKKGFWGHVDRVFNSRPFAFLNSFMTGVFLARIFFVKGAAILLPFLAATLSNPVTVAILLAVGVAYGAFRVYQGEVEKREAAAKEALEKASEHTHCLKQQVEFTLVVEKFLMKNQIERQEGDAPSPASTERDPSVSSVPLLSPRQDGLFGSRQSSSSSSPSGSEQALTATENQSSTVARVVNF